MSNNYQNPWDFEDDDDDFDDVEPTPAPSRGDSDLVRQLRKANRSSEKRLKELEAELQTLRSFQRENTVSRVLEAEGVNPRIAKFIPADVQEPDAVKAWLEENSELFGLARGQQEEAPSYDVSAIRQMDRVIDGALSPNQVDDVLSRLSQATSEDEILNMIYNSQ